MNKAFEKEEQKRLHEEYRDVLAKMWNGRQDMIDYCDHKAAFLLELKDGKLIYLERPSIEKHFCFDDS